MSQRAGRHAIGMAGGIAWRKSSSMAEIDIKGQIRRVVFVNPTNGYTVAHCVADGAQQHEVIVGNMPSLTEGDLVRVMGKRVNDPRFGRQVRVEYVEPLLPTSLEGTERYLASGAIHGVGKVTARSLVEFFKEDLLEVLEGAPDRLTEAPGIGKVKARAIALSWREKVASRRTMVGLYGLGLGTALATRMVTLYGEKAVGVVKANPYRLASEVKGVGFLTADRLAHGIGIEKESPARIRAGIQYFLDNQAGEGHCFYPVERLVSETAQFLELEIMDIEPQLKGLVEEGLLRCEARFGDDEVYLPRLFNAEVDTAQAVAKLLAQGVSEPEARLRRALEAGIRTTKLDLTLEQIEALWLALSARCAIITGGPGTGKTTVIKALIFALRHLNEEVQLCAPTGRAAKRMTETTGLEARTIHRMLEYNPSNGNFGRDDSNPVAATAIIVDEVSMIDVELMAGLLAAVHPGCRLILVGDKDQLESVGPGAVLRDLIAAEVVPVARFTQIHRQAERSLIVVNSHRILNGNWFQTKQGSDERADFFFLERTTPEECLETLTEMIQYRIPRKFGLDPVRDVQVITPMYKGVLGAQNLNQTLQDALNPNGTAVKKGDRVFRVGDRVMQIRNNYDKEVFNGDVGFVDGIAPDGLVVRMGDGRRVKYGDSDLDELTLAYAVTVHKSQGSEYPAVVMAVHTQHYVMLRRNLLYTGITRGKRLVVLVGTRRAAQVAISNDQTRKRYTRLSPRVREYARYGFLTP